MTALARATITLLILLFAAPSVQAQTSTQPPSRFSGWATAIVAADWRDGAGATIDVFDNALTDLSAAFVRAGLPREGMTALTLRPDAPGAVTPEAALARIGETTGAHTSGCLLYFTSHGSPEAMVFGERAISPPAMTMLTRTWCGTRPTVVVVSACFSGIFVDSLKAPNRMILTAASRDRTSFGCGAGEQYPWFDACVLESLPDAADFLALASATRACVTRRETEGGITADQSSNPQMFVGSEMQLRLPTLRFSRPSP